MTAVALLALGGVVYGYDRSRDDTIAKGVTVGGVDVGGLTTSEARAKLQREIVAKLRRQVVVDRGSKQWHLTAKEARLATNLDATVDEALARSRSGGILSRTWRNLTGGDVDADLTPEISFSHDAVTRLLARVKKAVNRDPVDATVDIGAGGVTLHEGKDGLALDTKLLRERVVAALSSPTGSRRLAAVTHHTTPKVSTEEARAKYQTVLYVNRNTFKLTLYKDLRSYKTYNIAVGAAGLETPAGLYNIQNKAVDPAWHVPDSDWAGKLAGKVIPPDDPANPIKARWMGIYDGAGIHGTTEDDSIGSAASHGCIRMHIPDVEDLYDRVPVGAPVYIA